MKPRRFFMFSAMLVPALIAVLAGGAFLLMRQGGLAPFRVPAGGAELASTPALVERGRYLAALGNCAGCHTGRGGAAYGGGRAFATAYGTVYSSNITPDAEFGIGAWSRDEFRHAMRHGVSRSGVLSPVFPYASFARLTDDDLDALLAFLRTTPPAQTPRRQHTLDFPANLPGAMTAWRMLYYRPAPAPRIDDPVLARGAYLVQGIGHCATCHGSRGDFASQSGGRALWGARNAGWHAPALHGDTLTRFAEGDVARYLRGEVPSAIGTYGLMADVVANGLQHLQPDDARAMEAWLRALPAPPPVPPVQRPPLDEKTLKLGLDVYAQHCADCHGERGEGTPGKYPALRGSSALRGDDPINIVKLVLYGAVAPTTADHPAPYTMPPFAQALSAAEIAALVNVLRAQEDPSAKPLDGDDVRALGGMGSP